MAAGLLAGISLLAAAAAPPAPPPVPRAELDGLQAAVEAAVSRVSRPAGLMAGRTGRAYHLEGYGTMIVLAPRSLPRPRRVSRRQEAQAFTELARGLEQHLATVTDPEERRRLEQALAALRDGTATPMPRISIRAPRVRPPTAREIRALQEEAESFRRSAEQAMERAERDVLFQLRVPAPPHVPTAPVPAAPPEPPDVVVSHMAVPPPGFIPRTLPVPESAPAPPAAPLPGTPSGWPHGPFWFGEAETDVAPEQLIASVRDAIVAGLAGHRGPLAHLRPDDVVAVAVDFIPRLADRGTLRTVVARAKKKDVAAAQAGRLARSELRARVVFDEY
jgi:hypothetical protein